MRILATLLRPDGGRARIAGYDVVGQAVEVRQLIALTGQFASVDDELTGTENLIMIGRLLGLSRLTARGRAREMIERFELTDAARRAVKTYSGGMRRRLDLAASLLGDPDVLFLDEPTTGLDPRARNQVWETIRRVVADGATVLLTTQYLDEADELADQIVVIDHGLVVADGTPAELKARTGGQSLVVRAADRAHDRTGRGRGGRDHRGAARRAPRHRPGHWPRRATRPCCRRWSGGWTRPASWPPSSGSGCPAWTRSS